MARVAAGLILYRRGSGKLEVLLVHPGGPLWQKKDLGAWSIPKGEIESGEDPLVAARREFEEETGFATREPLLPLAPVRMKGGKTVHAWAFEGDCDPAALRSNQFELEWPPRSGKRVAFPEIDRAAFFDIEMARQKINAAQCAFLDELEARLRAM